MAPLSSIVISSLSISINKDAYTSGHEFLMLNQYTSIIRKVKENEDSISNLQTWKMDTSSITGPPIYPPDILMEENHRLL